MRARGALLAAWLLVAAAMGLAQDGRPGGAGGGATPPPPGADKVIALLDVGFNGVVPAGSWAPVRVLLSGGDEPLEGVVRIAIDGGDRRLSVVAPAATTPGRESAIPLVAFLPAGLRGIDVAFSARGRGTIASASYRVLPGAGQVAMTPATDAPVFLGVGCASLARAWETSPDQPERPGGRLWSPEVASAVAAGPGLGYRLPTSPMAYTGLAAIVLDGQRLDRIEPAAKRALADWTRGGGRLVVVNASARGLESLLGDGLPRGPAIQDPRPVPAPRGGGTVVARPLLAQSLPPGWRESGQAPGGGRMRMQGPLGLGWLTLSAWDPDELAAAGDPDSADAAWGELLADAREAHEQLRLTVNNRSGWSLSPRMASLAFAFQLVGEAPAVGAGAFAVIFAMMALLAGAMGLGDRLVLRRLGLTRLWWVVAVGWIALATLGALIAPRIVRSGPTLVSRVEVVDAATPGLAGVDPGRATAWRAASTGVFLNQADRIDLDGLPPGAHVVPQMAPFFSGYGPTGGVGVEGLAMAVAPDGTPRPLNPTGRLWTLRVFRERGIDQRGLAATVERAEGTYAVRLRGVAGEEVVRATLHAGGAWYELQPPRSPGRGGTAQWTADMDAPLAGAPSAWSITESERDQGWWDWSRSLSEGILRPGSLFALPGAGERGAALAALGGDQRSAVVYVYTRSQRPVVASVVGQRFQTHTLHRVAAAVAGSSGQEPAQPAGGGR